jgi:hypothetical protein
LRQAFRVSIRKLLPENHVLVVFWRWLQNGRSNRSRQRDVPSVTHRFALVDFLNAYDTFSRVGETDAQKVVVIPLV